MTIDTNDTGTIDLLDKATDDAALEISNLRQQLEPLQALADAFAALPVFEQLAATKFIVANLADDLDDLRDRVESQEQSAEQIPTAEDVANEIEYQGTIESAVETILADKAEDPADDIDRLAAAVAEKLSVEIEIDDITVEASATVSVD